MPTTKKVRICLAIDSTGKWAAHGGTWLEHEESPFEESYIEDDLGEYAERFWITAEVPIPTPSELLGEVEGSAESAN